MDRLLPCAVTDIRDGIGRMFLLHRRHSLRQDSCASQLEELRTLDPRFLRASYVGDNIAGPKGLRGRGVAASAGSQEVSRIGF